MVGSVCRDETLYRKSLAWSQWCLGVKKKKAFFLFVPKDRKHIQTTFMVQEDVTKNVYLSVVIFPVFSDPVDCPLTEYF